MALAGDVTLFKGGPGRRRAGDDLAPTWRLEINDSPISSDINDFATSVEYESAVGMADLMRIVLDNPGVVDDFFPEWTAHKAFQPGNEVNLYVGYGNADRPENFIGRCQWAKHLPIYPTEEIPKLELKGYDLSYLMMDNTGRISRGTAPGSGVTLERTRPLDAADNQGEVFSSMRHSDLVALIADRYGLEKDIDHTERPESIVVKKGTKHFELLSGLANINNRDFWVDYDVRRRKWFLHWKQIDRNQQPTFTFRYNDGDASTLLAAEFEYGLRDVVNEATILVFDAVNQRWVSAIEIEDASGPSPIFRQGGGLQTKSTPVPKGVKKTKAGKVPKTVARSKLTKKEAQDVIAEAMANPAQFRIAAAGFAIDVLPPAGERFKSPEEAARFLLRWFQSKQDNFLIAQGVSVGVESLRARQVHNLKGLSVRLDGAFYFQRVRHILDQDGYRCEWTANKVIEE